MPPLEVVLPTDRVWAVDRAAFEVLLSTLTPAAVEVARHRHEPAPLELMTVEGGVAVIPLEGVMMKRPSVFQSLFGGASTHSVQHAVESATADPAVTAIVIRVDSPGGSADGVAELSDAVFEAAKTKPVVAHVSGLAASAALWAVAGADRIITGKLDMVGSIGARLLMFDLSRMFENAGIKTVVVDTGEFKSTGAPGVPITDRQIDHLQSIVDTFFDEFVSAVSRGRGMTDAAVRAVADGRIFLPRAAERVGLIDGIGTLDETLQALQSGRLPTGRQQIGAEASVSTPDGTKEINRMDPNKVTTPPAPSAPVAPVPAATAAPTAAPLAMELVVTEPTNPLPPALPPIAATGAPPPGSGAGLRELKAALPNADSDFLVDVSTRGLSVEQARSEWTAALEKRLGELNAAKSPSVPIGNATALSGRPVPYEIPTGADEGRAVVGQSEAVAVFDERVRERMGNGATRMNAVDAVIKADPGLHKNYLLATNPTRAVTRMIEDKLERVGVGA